MLWTAHFWKGAAERAVKTFAQAFVAIIGVDAVVGVMDVDWPQVFSVALLAGILSIATSVATVALSNDTHPTGPEPPAPAAPAP